MRLCKFACFLLICLPLWASAATHACRHPDFPQELQCGVVQRPLNPAQPDGKKIDVHYLVVSSQDKNKLPDAVFLLAGGPGQSAINLAAWGAQVFRRLNLRRDLVFVDQRGTGRSAPLHCPELEDNPEAMNTAQMLAATQRCAQNLQKLPYGDLRQFTTTIAMQDLDAVRQAQGYAQINLVGVSYGTRAGLEYLRLYPNAVRRLVIDGVVPPDMHLPASDAQAALQAVFTACEIDVRCNRAYPDLRQSWKKLLSLPPQQVTITQPRTGHVQSLKISTDMIVGMVHGSLYAGSTTAGLPFAITQALQRNFNPMLALSGYGNLPSPADITQGMLHSVWCSEEYARIPPTDKSNPFSELADGTMRNICERWPRGNVPAGFYTLARSPAPVLLTSGGVDPVTPAPHAVLVAQKLGAKARHLIVENAGHGALNSGCMQDVLYRFINSSDDELQKLDTSCVRQIPRTPAWVMPLGKNAGVPP